MTPDSTASRSLCQVKETFSTPWYTIFAGGSSLWTAAPEVVLGDGVFLARMRCAGGVCRRVLACFGRFLMHTRRTRGVYERTGFTRRRSTSSTGRHARTRRRCTGRPYMHTQRVEAMKRCTKGARLSLRALQPHGARARRSLSTTYPRRARIHRSAKDTQSGTSTCAAVCFCL